MLLSLQTLGIKPYVCRLFVYRKIFRGYNKHCFTRTDDGRLLFSADYTDMENLVTWLMTFGAKAEVLEPKEARDIIRRNAEETLKSYGGLGK